MVFLGRNKRRTVNKIDRAALSRYPQKSNAAKPGEKAPEGKGKRGVRQRSSSRGRRAKADETLQLTVPPTWNSRALWAWTVVLIAGVCFAYYPTFLWLEQTWRNEPDYSHGYLGGPLAGVLLWLRWESFPGIRRGVDWRGLWLIGIAVVMRVAGRLAYMDFMDGWSLVPMVAGVSWLLFGWKATRWAAPAIIFLVVLVPLPYRAETMLSWKLQGMATVLSTTMLRILGLPAIAEGHTLWIGESRFMIEQACSGLRIFVGVFAIAYFWAVTVNRSWIDRVVLMLAAAPMAILVNALRITITCILYQWFDSPEAHKTIHDWMGYLMIPAAAFLMWLVIVYWQRLYRPVQVYNPVERLQQNPQAV
ncbi:Transmembrane exosortase (Exosortase_EpsH) [Rosistilla oblonga]|nr:Transmembrane exosortase (Exosortase_EpsH) [Rosistilla oblonga]